MSNRPPSEAILHVVATPIGTLSDLSPRAIALLAAVDFIACEDTRHTGKLLAAHGLHVPLVSLHQHNERDRAAALIDRIVEGARGEAALVTDAGTPGVSDPGSFFVAAAHERGVRVLSAPGPSSLAAALGACGFEARRVVFSTFFPRERKEREAEIAIWLAAAPCIAVCFESPVRLAASLAFLAERLPAAVRVCVSREISKRHEEHVRGSAREVALAFAEREVVRGECVVSIELHSGEGAPGAEPKDAGPSLEEIARACLEEAARTGVPLKKLTRAASEGSAHSAKDLYAAAQSQRDRGPLREGDDRKDDDA